MVNRAVPASRLKATLASGTGTVQKRPVLAMPGL